MEIIGFHLTKIHAEKDPVFQNYSMNNSITFTDLNEGKVELLKDKKALKISFNYSLEYTNSKASKGEKSKKQGEVSLAGVIIISVSKQEFKEFNTNWKKHQMPKEFTPILYNFIIRKCSISALKLEEDLTLPYHIPIPQLKFEDQK